MSMTVFGTPARPVFLKGMTQRLKKALRATAVLVMWRGFRGYSAITREPVLMTQIAEIAGTDFVRVGPSSKQDGPLHSAQAGGKAGRAATLFWGLSGGTVLSIAGFIGLTLYQQNNDTLSELRKDLRQLILNSSEHVKREEVQSKMTTMWGFAKDLHAAHLTTSKELESAKALIVTQSERIAHLEERWKTADEDRKDFVRELQRLRERLATVEGRQAALVPPKSNSP
jgi:hypothetical protein